MKCGDGRRWSGGKGDTAAEEKESESVSSVNGIKTCEINSFYSANFTFLAQKLTAFNYSF